jgi:hypothetical protein
MARHTNEEGTGEKSLSSGRQNAKIKVETVNLEI